jgi:hypothetical protein
MGVSNPQHNFIKVSIIMIHQAIVKRPHKRKRQRKRTIIIFAFIVVIYVRRLPDPDVDLLIFYNQSDDY